MAKKLRELKAKLGELQGPEDNTVATRNFYKKHKVVTHPDPNGNGDDVYKASNVRTANRSPDHGYNPGEDAAVYEEVKSMTSKERIAYHKTQAAIHMGASHREKDPDKVKELQTQAKRHLSLIAQYERLQKNSYEPEGNKIDEIFGLSKKEKAEKAAKKMTNSGPWKRAMDAKKSTDAAKYYGMLKQSYDLKIAEIFEHLSEENKKHFIDILGEEGGYEKIAKAFGLSEEE